MTTDEIKAIAVKEFERSAAEFGMTGEVPVVFRVGWTDGDVQEFGMTSLQASVIMNSGAAKAALFGRLRVMCQNPSILWLGYSAETFQFERNESGSALTDEQFRKMSNRGFKTLVDLGFGVTYESVAVTVQSREFVALCTRKFTRGLSGVVIWQGDLFSEVTTQENYTGRSKMWGDLRSENIRG